MESCNRAMDRAVQDEAYIPIPFPVHLVDDHEWMQILATIDTCTIPRGTQFCDESGNDIVPICMVNIRHSKLNIKEAWSIEDAITFSDISSTEEDYLTYKHSELGYTNEHNEDSTDDDVVPESELEKIHILLKAREPVELEITKLDLKKIRQKQRSDRKKKQAQSRGRRR